MVEPDFGHWLAGFIDGEGCFIIQHINHGDGRRGNYMARFVLNLRDDDRPVVDEIVRQTEIGTVTVRAPSRRHANHGGQVQWQVQAKSEALALVLILDRFPLRAKKAFDFYVWREALLLWAQASPRRDNTEIWARMSVLKDELSGQRVYVPSGASLVG